MASNGFNQVIERETRATEMGLTAQVMFSGDKVRVGLDGSGEAPERIVLRFVHPTRAGEDRETVLMAVGPDWYQGALPGLAEGRWHILIEDGQASWRLKTMWSTDQKSLSIAARAES